MKCEKCGGNMLTLAHSVYHSDGSSSGEYWCQDCGNKKGWEIKGVGEQ